MSAGAPPLFQHWSPTCSEDLYLTGAKIASGPLNRPATHTVSSRSTEKSRQGATSHSAVSRPLAWRFRELIRWKSPLKGNRLRVILKVVLT